MNILKQISMVCAMCLIVLTVACNNSKNTSTSAKNKKDSAEVAVVQDSAALSETASYDKATTDTATAANVKLFLQAYLKDDLPVMDTADRKFSFYAIDLNGDKKVEYLISLAGKYFCGSGGCTFLLLGNNFKLINRFTVMRGPVFKGRAITNGWNDLIVHGRGKGKFVHLKYDIQTGKYPSNPSVVEETDVAPSEHDDVMWQDGFPKAKQFGF